MFDIQNTDGICLHKFKHSGAEDYVGIKGMLDMDVLERSGSYDGCAFSFSGKYGTSCFYQAIIGLKLSLAGEVDGYKRLKIGCTVVNEIIVD